MWKNNKLVQKEKKEKKRLPRIKFRDKSDNKNKINKKLYVINIKYIEKKT